MFEEILKVVEFGKVKEIEAIVQSTLDQGKDANAILNTMISAMDVIGEKFQAGEVFVPEMLISALTMKRGVEVLKPHLGDGGASKNGKLIIGTASGDLHDIGKNLVALMVESAGFEVIDLGVDVPSERFIETIKKHPDCHYVGISTLLTTTMDSMSDTVSAIDKAGLHDQVTVFVGGAPVSAAFAKSIGADCYTPDAGSAAQKLKELATAR